MAGRDLYERIEDLESRLQEARSLFARIVNDLVRTHIPGVQLERIPETNQYTFVARSSGYDQWSDLDYPPIFPEQDFVPDPRGVDLFGEVNSVLPIDHLLVKHAELLISKDIAYKIRQELASWW